MAKVFPNEVFPADSTIVALDGTTDSATGLPFIARGVGPNSTPTYEVQYNRRQVRQNLILSGVRQGMVVEVGVLSIGVYPIVYTLNGVRKSFDGATGQAVVDDATRVVYLDASNALQIQTAFPADLTSHLRLATVTAAAGVLTITDERVGTLFAVSPVDPMAKTFPIAPSLHVSGTLSTGVMSVEWPAPFDFTLRDATGRVAIGPVGADLIVDVRVNGTSIFASQSEMVVVATGQQQDTSATKDHAVVSGDVLTLDVQQVGSTTPGSDLTVVLNGLAAMDSV
jgi:hypothetical protein